MKIIECPRDAMQGFINLLTEKDKRIDHCLRLVLIQLILGVLYHQK